MDMKMRLDLFASAVTINISRGDHVSNYSTSSNPTMWVTGMEVKVIPTCETGYELDELIVVSGDAKIKKQDTFVVKSNTSKIYITAKKKDLYLVTERCSVCVNDKRTELMPNTEVQLTPNGAAKSLLDPGEGTAITMNDAVKSLIDQGILVKI